MKNAICFENNKNIIFHSHAGASSVLLPGEVHIWLATVDYVSELSLSAAEQMTLSAMKLPFAARRFESTRKLLRYLLGAYLQCPDGQIEKTDQGKPFLPEFPAFHFNITHSKELIMIALSQGPVGVDLERVRKLNVLPIAKRFFSPEELLFLEEEDQEQNQQTFFKLWTAKEAALKANGGGIAFGMKNNLATMEASRVRSIEIFSKPAAGDEIQGAVGVCENAIGFKRQSWMIQSWSLYEKSELFFGAMATLFIPTAIHWYDMRSKKQM